MHNNIGIAILSKIAIPIYGFLIFNSNDLTRLARHAAKLELLPEQ